MLKNSKKIARTTVQLASFALAGILAAACGKSGGGLQQCTVDPNAQSSQKDGDCCMYSINCQPGSICNDKMEDLYDSSKASQICVRVVCGSDSDCDQSMGKKCSLEKICTAPTCQIDSECPGGMACLGGACKAAPSAADVAKCEIVTRNQSIRQGQMVTLSAVAKNANEVVLPHIGFDWTSSNPGAVAVAAGVATGGAMADTAMISAKVTGKDSVTCTGLSIVNFPTLAAGMSRVVLADDDTGAPITGATITLEAMGGTMMGTTDQTGAALFTSDADIDSITVTKTGLQSISVLSPGVKDIFIPVPKVPDETKAGGFRGAVDISSTRHEDIQLGIAGPAIPNNLLGFDLTSLLGDSVKTVVDAPELGLNMQSLDLPGGVMLALGNKKFTVDTAQAGGGVRCEGTMPSDMQIGCYVARSAAGPGAGWVLAGQLKLSQVTSIATQLSNAFGGSNGGNTPIGDILTAVLPLVRTLNHGVNAAIDTVEYPKVAVDSTMMVDCTKPENAGDSDKCRGDYSKYKQITLVADTKLGVLSTITVPTLPNLPTMGCAGAAVLVAGAILPGRGLVPLGLSAGLDVLKSEPPDCKIAGAAKPFGDMSPTLQDGQLALSMAPPHAGIEGSKLFMLLLSLDPKTISGKNLELTALVKRKDMIAASESFGDSAYLPFPKGTLARAAGTFTLSGAVTGANVVRVHVDSGNDTWLIYAPAGRMTIATPNVTNARAVLTNANRSYIEAIKTSGDYKDVWTFGSGKTLDHFVDTVDAFVVQQCDTAATAACVVN
jgi:hypothetical protein